MFRLSMAAAVIGASLLGSLVPAAAQASTAAGPGITMQVVSVFGSGCPVGTIDAVPNADNTAFSLVYSQFRVYGSGGNYRSCVVAVRVSTPAGWTYRVPPVRYRARADLGAGAAAQLFTSTWFTGFPWTGKDEKQITGPFAAGWRLTAAPDRPVWAPCGVQVNLMINATLRVVGPPPNRAAVLTTTLGMPQVKRCQ